MKLVYTAFSKRNFYQRMSISKFVLGKGAVPINPFTLFDYFLHGLVNEDLIRKANASLVKRCDETWVFGEASNGVLKEIKLAKKLKKRIRYFDLKGMKEISEKFLRYEVDVYDIRA